MQVLTATQTTSDVFHIQARSFVRLEGTIMNTWNVQSKRRDSPTAGWQNEFETPLTTTTLKSPTIQGAIELEYRIVLGTGHEGPVGFVYETKQEIFK